MNPKQLLVILLVFLISSMPFSYAEYIFKEKRLKSLEQPELIQDNANLFDEAAYEKINALLQELYQYPGIEVRFYSIVDGNINIKDKAQEFYDYDLLGFSGYYPYLNALMLVKEPKEISTIEDLKKIDIAFFTDYNCGVSEGEIRSIYLASLEKSAEEIENQKIKKAGLTLEKFKLIYYQYLRNAIFYNLKNYKEAVFRKLQKKQAITCSLKYNEILNSGEIPSWEVLKEKLGLSEGKIEEKAIKDLIEKLKSNDYEAKFALIKIGSPSIPILIEELSKKDTASLTKLNIKDILSEILKNEGPIPFLDYLNHNSVEIRKQIALILLDSEDAQAINLVITYLNKEKDEETKKQVLLRLSEVNIILDNKEVTAYLISLIKKSADNSLTRTLAQNIGKTKNEDYIDDISSLLEDNDLGVVWAAVIGLGEFDSTLVIQPLLTLLKRPVPNYIKVEAIRVLSNYDTTEIISELHNILGQKDIAEKLAAIDSLTKIGNNRSIMHLYQLLLNEKDRAIKFKTALSLLEFKDLPDYGDVAIDLVLDTITESIEEKKELILSLLPEIIPTLYYITSHEFREETKSKSRKILNALLYDKEKIMDTKTAISLINRQGLENIDEKTVAYTVDIIIKAVYDDHSVIYEINPALIHKLGHLLSENSQKESKDKAKQFVMLLLKDRDRVIRLKTAIELLKIKDIEDLDKTIVDSLHTIAIKELSDSLKEKEFISQYYPDIIPALESALLQEKINKNIKEEIKTILNVIKNEKDRATRIKTALSILNGKNLEDLSDDTIILMLKIIKEAIADKDSAIYNYYPESIPKLEPFLTEQYEKEIRSQAREVIKLLLQDKDRVIRLKTAIALLRIKSIEDLDKDTINEIYTLVIKEVEASLKEKKSLLSGYYPDIIETIEKLISSEKANQNTKSEAEKLLDAILGDRSRVITIEEALSLLTLENIESLSDNTIDIILNQIEESAHDQNSIIYNYYPELIPALENLLFTKKESIKSKSANLIKIFLSERQRAINLKSSLILLKGENIEKLPSDIIDLAFGTIKEAAKDENSLLYQNAELLNLFNKIFTEKTRSSLKLEVNAIINIMLGIKNKTQKLKVALGLMHLDNLKYFDEESIDLILDTLTDSVEETRAALAPEYPAVIIKLEKLLLTKEFKPEIKQKIKNLIELFLRDKNRVNQFETYIQLLKEENLDYLSEDTLELIISLLKESVEDKEPLLTYYAPTLKPELETLLKKNIKKELKVTIRDVILRYIYGQNK